MTSEERMLIAEALRQRIIEITKLFEEPGAHVPQAEVPRAMKVQILLLAQALDQGFANRDRAFEQIFLETVRGEINRSEGWPEPQSQEAESNPWDKLWDAGVSEDGLVASVDPSDLKNVLRYRQEHPTAGAIGHSVFESVCNPGANVTAVWYRALMLGLCDRAGLLSSRKHDGEFDDVVLRMAATFPMKRMGMGVEYQGPPLDVQEFVRQIEQATGA
jgi:hypothetical protein